MAKPIDQLSPAYRRRLERAMAQGKTRQEARGHKPPPGTTESAEKIRRASIRAQSGWSSVPEDLRRQRDFSRAWLDVFDPAGTGGTTQEADLIIRRFHGYAEDHDDDAAVWDSFRETYDMIMFGR
jgi:hypothetical protein